MDSFLHLTADLLTVIAVLGAMIAQLMAVDRRITRLEGRIEELFRLHDQGEHRQTRKEG